jgi:hypothetical protein
MNILGSNQLEARKKFSLSGGEPELSGDLKDAPNGNRQFLRNRPTSQSLRPQTGNVIAIRI